MELSQLIIRGSHRFIVSPSALHLQTHRHLLCAARARTHTEPDSSFRARNEPPDAPRSAFQEI